MVTAYQRTRKDVANGGRDAGTKRRSDQYIQSWRYEVRTETPQPRQSHARQRHPRQESWAVEDVTSSFDPGYDGDADVQYPDEYDEAESDENGSINSVDGSALEEEKDSMDNKINQLGVKFNNMSTSNSIHLYPENLNDQDHGHIHKRSHSKTSEHASGPHHLEAVQPDAKRPKHDRQAGDILPHVSSMSGKPPQRFNLADSKALREDDDSSSSSRCTPRIHISNDRIEGMELD